MQRRQFLCGVGAVAFARPTFAQPSLPVIGVLGIGSAANSATIVNALREGLRNNGYVEGRNFVFEQRWAEGKYASLPSLAAELVIRQVSVIVAVGGTAAALAAKSATQTIPVVFQVAVDPVAAKLVARLDQPGGNLTGVSNLASELGPKRLELLQEILPGATNIAVLVNPANPAVSGVAISVLQSAASNNGIKLDVVEARSGLDFNSVFSSLSKRNVGGLVVVPDLVFVDQIETLAAMTIRHGLPAVFQFREFAAAGGLMSYGGSFTDANREIGAYAARVLSGEKPARMPIQQFTRIELIINLKTAKALGLSVPLPLLGRADGVIE